MTGLALLVAPLHGGSDTGALPASPAPSVSVPSVSAPSVSNTSVSNTSVSVPPPSTPPVSTPPVSTAPVADQPRAAEPPVRLVIAEIGVSAEVVDAPVEASGRFAVPADPRRVGWWVGGALPGAQTGTLAVAGHVDDRAGPGALFRIPELPVGAAVYVDGDTRRYAYRVTARRTYPKQHLPAEVFDPDVAHRLVLITCGGAFRDGHYDDNVVVYAEPVD
jgi:hypothetical protein